MKKIFKLVLCVVFCVFGVSTFAQNSYVYLDEGEPFVWFLPCELTDTVIYGIVSIENDIPVSRKDTIVGNVITIQNPCDYVYVKLRSINGVSVLSCNIEIRFYRRE